jgi:hypothetical protein
MMLRTILISITMWVVSIGSALAQLSPAPPSPPAPTMPGQTPPPSITLSDAPMQVHLVRSGPPGCEPHCTEWIAAQGQIDKSTVAQFKKVLAQIGERRPPVLIHSGGGSVEDAIAVARLIRAKGLDVAVGKTEFAPCAPTDTACRKKVAKGGLIGTPKAYLSVCASACPILVAGGNRRYVGSWALLGVHQISTFQKHFKVLRTFQVTTRRVGGVPVEVKRTLVGEKKIAEKTVQTQTKSDVYDRVREHFVAMGVSDGIMPMLRDTPSASMRWLKRPELLQLKMATDVTINGEQLIASLTTLKPDDIAPAVASPATAVEVPPKIPEPNSEIAPVAATPNPTPADPVPAASVATVPAAAIAEAPPVPAAKPSQRKSEPVRRPTVTAKPSAPSAPVYDFSRSR